MADAATVRVCACRTVCREEARWMKTNEERMILSISISCRRLSGLAETRDHAITEGLE